ncbi:LysR family transcriptional regulator [Virgibacillus halophilus]|uniref:LysR family transcriptional regulator n=1 Tax=Tigheibacillus halophilus TaxID=361280 RepID=A0ABU5C3Y1_9BACI|nr:LysR family transcriptional regulator [Virgibacillus halophilus]
MNIQELRCFEAVSRNKKFILAAEELHISQPALSNTIKRLEKKVGYKLLERSTKELSLTELGQVFNNHVCHLLSQFDNTVDDLEQIKISGGGKLKIGIIESSRYLMPQIIKQFKQVYPEIGIQIMEMSPVAIEEALNNYDIHLGITSDIKSDHKLTYSSIKQEQLSLAIPMNHKFANLTSINMIDLQEETLIHSLSGFGIRKIIVDACNTAGFKPHILYETESLELASNLVEIGIGVSVMPDSYLKSNANKRIKIVSFKDNIYKRSVYIAYHSQRYLQSSFHDLILIIKKNYS